MIGEGVLAFDVTDLNVTVEEGIKIKWLGKEIDSGRLLINLGRPGSRAVINYETGQVDVEFRAQITFEEIAAILDDMGADPTLTAPIDALIRSQGSVFEDHSLRLAGKAELGEHQLFDPAETRIEIRAPSQ
jgi:hypothetical protein